MRFAVAGERKLRHRDNLSAFPAARFCQTDPCARGRLLPERMQSRRATRDAVIGWRQRTSRSGGDKPVTLATRASHFTGQHHAKVQEIQGRQAAVSELPQHLIREVQKYTNAPWWNGEAYADFVGYRSLAIGVAKRCDEIDAIIEQLRAAKQYEQADALRVIVTGLRSQSRALLARGK